MFIFVSSNIFQTLMFMVLCSKNTFNENNTGLKKCVALRLKNRQTVFHRSNAFVILIEINHETQSYYFSMTYLLHPLYN